MLTIFIVGYTLLISYNLPFTYTVLAVNLEYENGFEVGRPHKFNCTVYIVDHTNVSISWSEPNDLITNESGRKMPFQLLLMVTFISENCNSQASMYIYCRKFCALTVFLH